MLQCGHILGTANPYNNISQRGQVHANRQNEVLLAGPRRSKVAALFCGCIFIITQTCMEQQQHEHETQSVWKT